MNKLLQIKNLHINADNKKILKGVDLEIGRGEIHALMGPNGSGKSTLAQVLDGNPQYKMIKGEILFYLPPLSFRAKRSGVEKSPANAGGHSPEIATLPTVARNDSSVFNLLDLSPDERAKLGLFLAFQNPIAVPGVSFGNFLRLAYNTINNKKLTPIRFKKFIKDKLELLKINENILERSVNDGFSGGEKKKTEILQMAMLEPKLSILDETDSGLDVDALKIVANGIKSLINRSGNVNSFAKNSPDIRRGQTAELQEFNSPHSKSILLITHYQRIFHYIKPDKVHVMKDGKIVKSGGHELAEELEKKGYQEISNS